MIELPIYDKKGKQVDTLSIDEATLGTEVRPTLLKQAYVMFHSNRRQGSARTKSRGMVEGSTRKIYKQKGTGNARHASRKAPIFVGGGVAHGPKGQSAYKKRKLNKGEKRLSISSLISEKNKLKNLVIFSDFKNEIKKTKEMYKIINKFEIKNSLIILDKLSKDNIRIIRPSYGIKSKYYDDIIGKKAIKKISKGTALQFSLFK